MGAPGSANGRLPYFNFTVLPVRIDSLAGVTHRQSSPIRSFTRGLDQKSARPIIDFAHRVDRVEDNIQDDLLKLHAIATDRRQIVSEVSLQSDPIGVKLT